MTNNKQDYNGCCSEVRVYDANKNLKYTIEHKQIIKEMNLRVAAMSSKNLKHAMDRLNT